MAGEQRLRITIPGRPRSWKRTGGSGRRRFDVQKTAKGVLQVHAIQAIKKLGVPWPLDWSYQLRVDAFWPLAKSKHRKQEPVGMEPRPMGADWDNLGKLVGDALEGVCWENDRQIVDGRVVKWTSKQGEPGRTVINVTALPDFAAADWRALIGR